jgi:hypothetical protein
MAQKFYEGQTAKNPQTGQRIMYQKGRWVPIGGGGAAAGGAQPQATARQLATREAMQLDEMRTAARTADEAARTAEQFVELNKRQGSGQIWSLPWLAKAAGAFDPEIAQMNALTARMAPQQRVPGSGTTSDRDLSLFLQAVPGMDRPGKANQAIARQARADADRRKAYVQFLDRYAQQNGTLLGAEEAWEKSQKQQPARPAQQKPQGGGWKVISVE